MKVPSRYRSNGLAAAIAVLLICGSGHAHTQQPMFPFVIPWDDSRPTAVDVSQLNPAPINATRRITVKGSHFVDETGRRVRFLGTNFTFSASFPNKADAGKVAARMHKYGFNIVRLHHMDIAKAPTGIFDPKYPDMQHLDADQLDRLDYLVSEFRKHGIYVDLNLHVSRAFHEADGFPNADRLPEMGKVTAYFYPREIELQRNYARDLLTHYNPYSKTRWADDPTVAVIEINNEDTLVGAAWGDTLRDLPEPYHAELARQWNQWLAARYKTTGRMMSAWTKGNRPLGSELLRNSLFAQGTEGWTLEMNQPSVGASMVAEPVDTAEPAGQALRYTVQRTDDADWHLQLHQTGLNLKRDVTYTLQFWARASSPRRLRVYSGLDQAPWSHTGLEESVNLTTRWQCFRLPFAVTSTVPAHSRITMVMGAAKGDIWIASTSLRSGIAVDLPRGASLERRNLPMSAAASATPQGTDYIAFLMDVERRFAQGMRSYVRNTLKSRAPVVCSQASYGGVAGVAREFGMDYTDMHAYWQHPTFPHKAWDSRDWNIPNTSMVTDLDHSTLRALAMHRIAGRPFTVSEYNHPAPNDFSAEGLVMAACYAVQQDWDGIFLFDYNSDRNAWSYNAICGFFDMDTDPSKMALMPSAAAIILRGRGASPVSQTLTFPLGQAAALSAHYGPWLGGLWSEAHMRLSDYLTGRVALAPVKGAAHTKLTLTRQAASSTPPCKLVWRTSPEREARFVWSSGSDAALVGFVAGTAVTAGPLTFEMESTDRRFAVATLTRNRKSWLLTAIGKAENLDMGFNADRTSVSNQWGHGPAQVEGIPATVTARIGARQATVWALDATGARLTSVPCTCAGGSARFKIGPAYRTVWYEIVPGKK